MGERRQVGCPRGRASPDQHTQRKLFAASGGYCQNPACSRELFIDYPQKGIHIAEIAHVFAANDDGPRAKPELPAKERGAFDNLILLCSVCHTIVDKAPEVYPDRVIRSWKREHADKLRSMFGVTRFDKRSDARNAIGPPLRENRAIFEEYGPYVEEGQNPESGAAERWKRKVLVKIIPNNRKVIEQLDANIHLLTDKEVGVLEKFRQHLDDLEARHLVNYEEGASRFPAEMESILKD
jgi:hypothetical protein